MSARLSIRHICNLLKGSGNTAEYRWKESKGQKIECRGTDDIFWVLVMNSLHLMLPTLSPHKNGPINTQAWMEHKLRGPTPSLLGYLLL